MSQSHYTLQQIADALGVRLSFVRREADLYHLVSFSKGGLRQCTAERLEKWQKERADVILVEQMREEHQNFQRDKRKRLKEISATQLTLELISGCIQSPERPAD